MMAPATSAFLSAMFFLVASVVFGMMFEYVLWTAVGKHVPMWVAMIVGLLGSVLVFLVWVGCLVSNGIGIHTPWIHL